MVEIKTEAEIALMREAGGLVARILAELSGMVAPGVNLMDLEHRCREMIRDAGATSCYWDYDPDFGDGPFRNTVCLSLNDAALHGLPHPTELSDGDLLSIDLAVELNGWCGDSAVSVIAGEPGEGDLRLVEATRVALDAGIAAAKAGNRLGDVSHAIGEVARDYGIRPNAEYGGHDIGRHMHGDLVIPNVGRAHRGLKLQEGMTFAIEPWFAGTDRVGVADDGWTVVTMDGSRAAHSEHTVVIRDGGGEILTAV
ncbi:type I methionyl aminopeptidase [uncultured Corynebacterium sp.]|uniref:type I methionyl aminopeptidase n=1 Tax=uncultured Corynebacterium sp. TaxID=159447 RepID=UPI0025F1B1C6|nr:type I methionyl aminopeptidase [uncultured Corynebacterium sp.]